MAPRCQARNSKPDSVAANPEAAWLRTSLFTKEIVKKDDKARKFHQLPTLSTKVSKIALGRFRKRNAQLYVEKFKRTKNISFFQVRNLTNLCASFSWGDSMWA